MPRSRTSSGSCNLGSSTASIAASDVSNTLSPLPAAVGNNGTSTDWRYQTTQRRTASLSRNLTRRSRSVTMPNMKENGNDQPQKTTTSLDKSGNTLQQIIHPNQQFSTFKQPTNNTLVTLRYIFHSFFSFFCLHEFFFSFRDMI